MRKPIFLVVLLLLLHSAWASAQSGFDLEFVERIGRGSLNEVVAFSPVDDRFAVGGTNGLWLFADLEAEPQWIDLAESAEETFNATSLLWSADGTTILASDGTFVVAHDLDANREIYRLDGMGVLALSTSGEWFAYNTLDHLLVADIATGETLYDLDYEATQQSMVDFLEDHGGFTGSVIEDAAFGFQDEKLIVTWTAPFADAGNFGARTAYHFWELGVDLTREEWTTDLTIEDFFTAFYGDAGSYAYSPGELITETNNVFVSGYYNSQDAILGWELIPGVDHFAMIYSRFDIETATSQYYVSIWEVQSDLPVATHELPFGDALYRRITMSADFSYVASGLNIFDLASGELFPELVVDEYDIFGQGENARLLFSGADNTVRLLDAATREEVATLPFSRNQLKPIYQFPQDAGYIWPQVQVTDESVQQLRVSLETGEVVGEFEAYFPRSYTPNLSPNGVYVRLPDSGEIFTVESAELIPLPDASLIAPTFAPDNRIVLNNDEASEILLLDVLTQETLHIPYADLEGYGIYQINFLEDMSLVQILLTKPETYGYWVQVFQLGSDGANLLYETLTETSFIPLSEDAHMAYQTPEAILLVNVLTSEVLLEHEAFATEEDWQWGTAYHLFITGHRLHGSKGQDAFVYDWELGEYVDNGEAEEHLTPYLETGDLNFYSMNVWTLRITDATGETLYERQWHPEIYRISLSEEGDHLFFDFLDGTVEVWAIQR